MKRVGIVGMLMAGLMGASTGWVFAMGQQPPASSMGTMSQLATTEGSITALDLQAVPPRMTVSESGGKLWTLVIDPATTVWQDDQLIMIEQLSLGQWVKVLHEPQGAQEVVKSIQIAEAPAAPPAPMPTAPPTAPSPVSPPVPAQEPASVSSPSVPAPDDMPEPSAAPLQPESAN